MIKIILLITLLVECAVTEETNIDLSLGASGNLEYYVRDGERPAHYKDGELQFTEAEKRIVEDVFSPDYYEPNVILDYRYLKTGGRGYARSDGGQILILPRREHMPPPQNNYDTLLEYLRLKHLEKISKTYRPNSRLYENYEEGDGGMPRQNMKENRGENMKENMGGNMRLNMGGNKRGNIGGNMRENKSRNMGSNMRENMGGNTRENMRDDRRKSGYHNEKLYNHDVQDRFLSDAELGFALYNH